MLTGKNIFLRYLQESDVSERYLAWLSDPDTTRFLETKPGKVTLDELREFVRSHVARSDSRIFGIFDNTDQRHLGNVKLEPIVREHGRAVLGILVGDGESRGRGIGTEAVNLALNYAFSSLNLHRVSLGVISEHEAAIRCYQKAGFLIEGRNREAVFRDGVFVDSVTMSILAHEFESSHAGN